MRKNFTITVILACLLLLNNFMSAQTVLPNVQVNNLTPGDQETAGHRAIAVDGNNVYVIYQDENSMNDRTYVRLARSSDGGLNFQPSVMVKDSLAQGHGVFPSVTTNSAGDVFCAWTLWNPTPGNFFIGPRSFNGYIDELRICKDTAIWTSNFTPPTAPYPVQTGNHVKLLLNMENSNFTDSSLSSHQVYMHGNLQQNTTVSKFGSGSAYFDGQGTTYLSIPFDDDFDFGSGDFTIDYWVRFQTLSVLDLVFAKSVNGSGTTGAVQDGTFNFYYFDPQKTICFSRVEGGFLEYIGSTYGTWSPVVDVWYHVAGVRHGNSWKIYIDGVEVNSDTKSGGIDTHDTEVDIIVSKSTNGGTTFQDNTVAPGEGNVFPSIATHGNNVYVFYADLSAYPLTDMYVVRSTDGGTTYGTSIKINDANSVEGLSKVEGINAMHVDNNGHIHLVWQDTRRAGSKGDIYYSKSTDNGLTFSANIPVHSIISALADSTDYYPSVAVGGLDTVYVTWTREILPERVVYMARSINGGVSFEPEIIIAQNARVADIAACTGIVCVAYNGFVNPDNGMWLNVSNDGGNTFSSPLALNDPLNVNEKNISIVMDQNSVVYAVWTDHRNTEKDVFFTKTSSLVSIFEIEQSTGLEFSLMQNSPNPCSDETKIRFSIPIQTNVKLKLFDFSGKEIAVLVDATLQPGVHSISLNTRALSQGIYFYQMDTEQYSSIKKLIIIN